MQFHKKLTMLCMSTKVRKKLKMKSIDEHIQKDQSEIESAKAEGNLPKVRHLTCLLYTSPSPRDLSTSRMPSSA